MTFDVLCENVLKQLELDFRDIPVWAKKLGEDWDNEIKRKYYPIKNMQKGKQRDAAFRKFWLLVVNKLRNKQMSDYDIMQAGVPEYIFHLHH